MTISRFKRPYSNTHLNELLATKGLCTGIGEPVLQYAPSYEFKKTVEANYYLDSNYNIMSVAFKPNYGWRTFGLLIKPKGKTFKLTQAQKTIFRSISKNKVGLGKKDQRSKYLKKILRGKL